MSTASDAFSKLTGTKLTKQVNNAYTGLQTAMEAFSNAESLIATSQSNVDQTMETTTQQTDAEAAQNDAETLEQELKAMLLSEQSQMETSPQEQSLTIHKRTYNPPFPQVPLKTIEVNPMVNSVAPVSYASRYGIQEQARVLVH